MNTWECRETKVYGTGFNRGRKIISGASGGLALASDTANPIRRNYFTDRSSFIQVGGISPFTILYSGNRA